MIARFDLGRAFELLLRASLPLIAATLAALLAANLLAALRWHLIASAAKVSPGPTALLKLVLVGAFFNQVLPTGVGGDAVRAWRCSKMGIGLGAAIRSILLDRACGYLVLIVVYAVSLPRLLDILPEGEERAGVLAVLVVAIVGLLALVSLDRLPRPILRLRAIAPFAELSREGRFLLKNSRRSAAIIGLSALTIGLTILAFKLLADAIGSPLSLASWMIIVPPVTLIQLLPVSVAGWGLREVALVVALGLFGVPAEAALATSVLMGFCLILIGLPGSVIWLTDWDIAPYRGVQRVIR